MLNACYQQLAGAAHAICRNLSFASLTASNNFRQKRFERSAIKIASINDHGADFLGVRDVFERVGIEEYEIGELASLDCPQIGGSAEEDRRVQRGRLQGLGRRESAADEQLKLVVQAEARVHKRTAGIATRQQRDSGTMESAHHLQLDLELR